jgi:3-hydroxymyristoyl/3-hydroxydecanoyl-(acyl carrier protein) dehydratase
MELERIAKRARRHPLFDPSALDTTGPLGPDAVARLLSHRDPMLFVDRVSAYDLAEESLVAHRSIDPDDPVFGGHFPGQPVYPGALLVETVGQASLCLQELIVRRDRGLEPDADVQPAPLRLLRVREATFVAEVRPGDQLTILCRRLYHDSYIVGCIGQILRNETICTVAILEVYLVDDED